MGLSVDISESFPKALQIEDVWQGYRGKEQQDSFGRQRLFFRAISTTLDQSGVVQKSHRKKTSTPAKNLSRLIGLSLRRRVASTSRRPFGKFNGMKKSEKILGTENLIAKSYWGAFACPVKFRRTI
ncbi:MAG: hypothetical protein KKE59_09490 [Proteobacteria bacterium]|nr:hypothetical protein [Pseudomonadota bacterium]